jgi:methyl-accepting chemotaxis protein
MQSTDPVGDERDTYSEVVDNLAETTGEHFRSIEGLDSAMASLKESVIEMNAAVDEYFDAITELDNAVASLQRTATDERARADTPTARPNRGPRAASD